MILKISAPEGLSTSHPFSQDFTHPRSCKSTQNSSELTQKKPLPRSFRRFRPWLGPLLSFGEPQSLAAPLLLGVTCHPGWQNHSFHPHHQTPSHGKEQIAQCWPESLYGQNREHFPVPQSAEYLFVAVPFYLLWFNVHGWNLTVMTTAGASPPASQAWPGSL